MSFIEWLVINGYLLSQGNTWELSDYEMDQLYKLYLNDGN